jgi:iron complex transport system ATP-binding protein
MIGTSEWALSIEGITVRYGDRSAVRSVSFGVRAGEMLALAGPNGSGKSSLLRAAVGLTGPAAGVVRVEGVPVAELDLRARARAIAWMPQEEPLGDNISVEEYVLYGRYAHIPRFATVSAMDRRAAARALAEADVGDLARRGMAEVSGGERQRVRLARVLAQEAPVLLLDETTAHLDMGHQLDVLARVRAIARREHRAVVLALHDLNLAARFADRVAVLSHGHLVAHGPPSDVLSPALLAQVWGIVAVLRRDAATGLPYLIPELPGARTGAHPPSPRAPRVHLVAGGGSGVALLPQLADAGYELSVGVVPLFDSDTALAEEIGVRTVVEVPFAPVGPEARERLSEMLDAADAIVVAAFPVGPTNLSNLEDLLPFPARKPVLLLEPPGRGEWDYTGGTATRTRERLRAAGAITVRDIPSTLALLDERLLHRPAPTTAPLEG